MPLVHHPVAWYGVLFGLGFFFSYLVTAYLFSFEVFSKWPVQKESILDENRLLKTCQSYPSLFDLKKQELGSILPQIDKYIKAKILPLKFFNSKIFSARKLATALTDQLTTYLVLGIIVGARLGYVFFYGWPLFKENPLDVFKIWEGGLASHGACIGVLVGLLLFMLKRSKEKLKFSFLHLLDVIVVPTGLMAFFIRLGNFMNQEIVGTASNLPWAVIFASPFGGEAPVPRHPVQLYEALFYLFLVCLSFGLWKGRKVKMGEGQLAGIVLSLLFLFRFFIEFLKEHQGLVVDSGHALQMGQILSVPFFLFGLILALKPFFTHKQQYTKSPL